MGSTITVKSLLVFLLYVNSICLLKLKSLLIELLANWKKIQQSFDLYFKQKYQIIFWNSINQIKYFPK